MPYVQTKNIYINPVQQGADAWAAFRAPEANAAALTRNDAAPVTTPRPPIPSTGQVWGDQEAQDAGLYETADPWAAFKAKPQPAPQAAPQLAPAEPLATFEQRFPDQPAPQPDLQEGLTQRAEAMTRGPATTPMANMTIGHENILSAASQGTDPSISRYQGKLISKDVFQGDDGSIQYRDPATGAVVPTDAKTQIALRDPADNTVKIYARTGDTNENPAVGASRVMTQGLLAGAPTARPGLAAVPKAGVVKASDIFATSKQPYREFAKEAGKIEVPVETAKGIADRIRLALDKGNLIEELAKPVYSAIGIFDKGEPMTLDALQNIKRVVGRSFNSPDKNVRDAAAIATREIGKVISEVSPEAGDLLKRGDAIHAAAASVRGLQQKAAIADLRTGRAGYGGNAVNSMRQLLSPIVQKSIEGRITGFKPNEIAAMRDIVEGTTGTNAARFVGQLSPAKGIIQTGTEIGTAIAGGAALGPVGVAAAATLPIAGIVGNKLAAVLTGKQLERLNELVAKRSPAYAEAVSKAVDRWEKTQAAAISKPTPALFGAYISASRALASGLTRDGIKITSGDLMKMIGGPMKSAAEEDQPNQPAAPGVTGD